MILVNCMKKNIDSDTLQLLEAIKEICVNHICVRPYNIGYSRIYGLIIDFIVCHSIND